MILEKGYTASFGLEIDRVYELAKSRKDLLTVCHTHSKLAYPSLGDVEDSFCGIIIGFKKTSKELNKLASETFGRMPRKKKIIAKAEDFKKPEKIPEREWKKLVEDLVGREVYERIPFDIPKGIYNKIIEECHPTIRFFYTNRKNELKRIPLYLHGIELE
jgi:hypothetical protein